MIKGKKLVTLLAVVTIAVLASPVLAGYTQVTSSSEPNHAQILGDIYDSGISFYEDGFNYCSLDGTITAYRIDDFFDGEESDALDIVTAQPGEVTDQVWTGADVIATVTLKAKHAGLEVGFGWNNGGLDPTYQELLTEVDPSSIIETSGEDRKSVV